MNLQRLLIERMENRILVGTVMFLGIMVLIGWVAINEQGRMQAFERQHLGRSIERGAELFAANCSECHGTQGYGIVGRAPALNNPSLFGHNFFARIDNQVEQLESARAEIEQLEADLQSDTLTLAEREEIEAQLAAYREDFGEDAIASIEAQLNALESERQALMAQLQPAIERGYNPDSPDRLAYLGWGGTLHSFVQTTLISGRPTSESYWPQSMAAWSQRAGGPLRDDQIDNLVDYILNWNKLNWTVEDLLAVQQFAIRPGIGGVDTGIEPVAPGITALAEDEAFARVVEITDEVMSLEADAVNGQALYNGAALGCAGCHSNVMVAPLTEETWAAVTTGDRLDHPDLAGYTPEQYIVESILLPNAFIVNGYVAGAMPQNFGERLDAQMLADIIAYLQSYEE
jgi:mono/diheme cytochrome c family protein